MVEESTFSSALAFLGTGDDGVAVFAVFAATDDGFAFFAAVFDFGFVGVRIGVKGAGFSSIGALAAAVLSKHPCEVQLSNVAYGGVRQLQPIKVADNVPMKSVLMRFPPRGCRVPLAFLAAI
jgi:hypothetical protein